MPPMERVAGGLGGGQGMQPPSSEAVMDGLCPMGGGGSILLGGLSRLGDG